MRLKNRWSWSVTEGGLRRWSAGLKVGFTEWPGLGYEYRVHDRGETEGNHLSVLRGSNVPRKPFEERRHVS